MASSMKICSHCQRHLRAPEPRCPFCGARLPTAASALARGQRVVMFGLTMALGSVGCGPGLALDDGDPTGMSDGDTIAPTTTTTMAPETGSDGPVMTTSMPTTGTTTLGTDSATEDTGVDDADDQGCSFYAGCAPDGGGIHFECELIAQDCPEGEKCMPWADDGGLLWNATRCSPIDDSPAGVGEPCVVEGSAVSGLDDCAQGLMCFEVDPNTNQGTCDDLCGDELGNLLCPDPDEACVLLGDLVPLCRATCDPALQDCPEGQGCFPADDAFVCLPASVPPKAHGDPCLWLADCSPGQVCLASGAFTACAGANCCSTLCALDDPDADTTCAALDPGQGCQPWYDPGMAPAGLETAGVCALP
ncbi:MAG: hypothetical protein KDK70_18345 [Myxococcales bacterium]|nr:hypothetical protein [Myxococcales bacterium]